MPPDKKRHKLIAYIDEDTWEETQRQAAREDRSATAVVRRALRQYLDQQTGKT